MAADDVLEVLSLARAIDVVSGRMLTQVTFGHTRTMTDEIKARLRAAGQPDSAEQFGQNVITYNFLSEGPVPYRLGSRWRLTVGADGKLSLVEVL